MILNNLEYNNKQYIPSISNNDPDFYKCKATNNILNDIFIESRLAGDSNDKYLSFFDICNIHNEIFADIGIFSGRDCLNFFEDNALIKKRIYNNFFTNRANNIFITTYDEPLSIIRVINQIFYDLGNIDTLKNSNTETKINKLITFTLKLFQSNIFTYGNLDVIFIILAHTSVRIDLPLINFYNNNKLNFNVLQSILINKSFDDDNSITVIKQLELFFRSVMIQQEIANL